MINLNKKSASIAFLLFFTFFISLFMPTSMNNRTNLNDTQFDNSMSNLKSQSDSLPLELKLNETWGTVNDDEFHSMTLDSEDNVYIAGFSNWNILIAKFNSSFELEWSDVLPNANGQDYGEDIALDSENNVYLVGKYSPTGATHSYLALLKYNETGDFEWMKTWGGEGNVFTYGHAIVIDSADNIFVAGKTDSMGAGEDDICLIKYNTTGDVQWFELWGGSQNDNCNDIILDDDGNLYLVGSTDSYGVGSLDTVVIKYNSTGDQQWNKTWGGVNAERAYSVALDSADNIYIGGTAQESEGDWHAILLKYTPAGNFVWSRTWDGANSGNAFYGLSINNYDQIYLTSITNLPYNGFDMVILSYSSYGDLYWEYVWGTAGFDMGLMTTLSDPNNLIVAGITIGLGAGEEDGLLLKFQIHPILTINSPIQDAFFSISPPAYSITVVSPTLDTLWYTFDDGLTNYTSASSSGVFNSSLWTSLSDGQYNVFFYANDSSGEIFNSKVMIHKDTTSPISVLSFKPYKGINKVNSSTLFTIHSSDGNGSGIMAIYYRMGYAWGIALDTEVTSFYLHPSLEPGIHLIEFHAKDKLGNDEKIQSVEVELIETEQTPETPAIPGYNILILISSLCLMVFFIVKKKPN